MKHKILSLFVALSFIMTANAEGLEFAPKPLKLHPEAPAFTQKIKVHKAPISHAPAEVVSGSCGMSLNWSFDTETGTLTITGSGAMYDFEDIYDNDSVWLAYSTPWFSFKDEITTVSLPYGLSTIGKNAFAECYALASVNIPNSVLMIKDFAFSQCTSLSSITIPASVRSIGKGVFAVCNNLANVTIANGVASLGTYCFYSCPSLISITIPGSVTTIGDYTFYLTSNLTSVTLSEGTTAIGEGAFFKCASLASINIPGSVTTIGDYAFYNDSTLTSVTLSEGLTSIGYMAFRECTGLTSIDIPNTVTSLGTGAFYICSGLTSVTIPESVTSINQGATFQHCTSLTSVQWNAIDCVMEEDEEGNWYPPFFDEDGHITNFTFGEQVTTIPTGLCDYMLGLTSVTLPNSVTTIGTNAFAYSTNLTSVTLNNGLTSIGESAFENCTGLTSINIPNTVTSLGTGAFFNCSGLTSVTIPENVTTLNEGGTFQGCTSLTSMQWNAIDCVMEEDEEGHMYPIFYDEEGHITNFTFGEQVRTIPEGLCNRLTGITSIILPNSVRTIGYRAFYNCSALTSITIPENVTTLQVGATFQGCTSLTSVQWNAVNCTLEANESGNFYAPFWNLNNLTHFTLGDNVVTIPRSLFYGLPNLTSVVIPESVTSIGEMAFRDCTGLTSIEIPSGVTTIGDRVFYNCSSLNMIYNHAITPQYIESDNVFYNVNLSCVLKVPYQSLELYQYDDGWSYFYNIIPEAMTVDQLLALDEVQALVAGRTTSSTFTVRGYVTKVQTAWSSTKNYMTFWIDDVDCGDQNKFEIYRGTNANGIAAKVGDYVECTGAVFYYNGQTYEMPQGSSYTIITEGEVAQELGVTTIANFIAEQDCRNTYTLTGIVSNIVGPEYGNFDLTDATGTIFIYGLLTPDGRNKQFATMDIEEGDEVTLKGVYSSLNDSPEIVNATFVSRRKAAETAIDQTLQTSAANKLLRDGQIFILRGDHTYTLTGQEIK